MKKAKTLNYLSWIMYGFSIIILILFVILGISNYLVDHKGLTKISTIITFGVLFCIMNYFGGLFNSIVKKNNKCMKINTIIYLIVYLLLVFFFTVINRGLNFASFSRSANLIPLKGIIEYVIDMFRYAQFGNLVMIIGNFFVLIPLAYFYPRILKTDKKFFKFIIAIVGTTITIEFMQFLCGGGIFDIDDVILNSLGPICFYPLFNKGFFSKTIDKILLLENNDLKVSDIIKSITLIIMIIVVFISCVYFYWYYDSAISIDIIDENNICEEGKTLIYEDDIYKYYYGCKDTSNLYIIFNQKHKFLLTDFINNKVRTIYTKKFKIGYLKDYDFIYEPKYPKIEIELKDSLKYFYFEEEGIAILKDNVIIGDEKGLKTFEAILQPLKSGNTKLYFELVDHENMENCHVLTYEITVDKNLNVIYDVIE